ncbi:exonuclease domain-containing protein [Paralimibaculum aggregatum]|uniref:DNA-directed DNA polymerase n=1 Tax=Paralimibaculum aggregatum TaxID=3036245 RepID=A0ABQ6LJT2_9RHOB|nr:exonuclease domain-containing protein [Limibaculum sp. NKW23]GMG81038.1 exonuclease domain-containing protein [Limibaculum sp. NKW23]
MAERWSLRLRIFLFFALVGLGGLALFAGALVLAGARIGPEATPHLVLAGGIGGLGLLVLTAWVWQLFDENVARPIMLLSGELSATAEAKSTAARLSTDKARYLGALGPAAAGIAEALGRERSTAEGAVKAAIDEVLAEKAQLEAVLRDLRECVLICNLEHEILLYNAEAQRLLGLDAQIGLGRPLFRLVTEQPVRHALDRVKLRFADGRHRTHHDYLSVAVVCATRDGRLTLQGRLSLILDAAGDAVDGFVLTLRDATQPIADHAARDHLLKEMLEGLRRPTANLRAAAEILSGGMAPDAKTQARFVGVMTEEAETLARRIDRLAGAYNELRIGGWSMNDVTAIALVACARDRLADLPELELAHAGADCWLNCDSFSVVEMLALFCREIAGATGVGRIEIAATPDGGHVFVDLVWQGVPLGESAFEPWLNRPLVEGLAGLTARDVLLHHRTEIWSERVGPDHARLRLPLQPAVEDHVSAPASELPARPEFYDFSLLRRRAAGKMAETPLTELACVVFDTETTGLFPSAGDEIVQIAGVRVLNGRVIRGERFDRLIDPGRRIPAASTRIHGITDAMVADQPDARAVLPAFHDFAADAVLVAHNAPFDLKFLQLKEGLIGRRFDNPVLDTVLLSAHLFGHGAEHTLDALAERFGIGFPEGQRHTAFADALVTAEVLCMLIPVLNARGVRTLGDALAVSDEAVAIRRKQARY